MPGRRNNLTQLRRTLYLTQRTIGDVQAAQRGKLTDRLARRQITRTLLRIFR